MNSNYFLFYFKITAKTGLIHIGVFILLLLSGERNFGVRLNKPYISRIPIDIPVFSGTHADLLVIVKINYILFNTFMALIYKTNKKFQYFYSRILNSLFF